MHIRNLFISIIILFFLSVPLIASDQTALYLMRVERNAQDDLIHLLKEKIPVVMEMERCFFVIGTEVDQLWLLRHGFAASILHDDPEYSDYLIIGMRPDSNLDLLYSIGKLLDQDENWVLLRTDRDISYDALYQARVFMTKLPHESMLAPREVPQRWKGSKEIQSERGSFAFGPADPLVQKIVDEVDTADIDALWHDVTENPPTGTRYSSSQGCRDAAAYCRTHFESLGLPAEYQNYNPSYGPNVVATQEGGISPDQVYLIEGHLDDLPSSGVAPGADDNASGSVTVLEAAKAMSCWGFKSTVKYLTVTGEEQGLHGSNYYADTALAQGENILGVINMDMNGWEGNGTPVPENLDLDYNGPSQWLGELFAECSVKYSTGLVVDAFYCPSLNASDHYPFWQNGYHAICGITDNEGYCGHGGNYPYYHTSNDTIANCGDPTFFYGAVRTSIATLAEMAEPFKVTMTKPAYGCGTDVGMVVADRDLNTDPGMQETVTVEVWSDTETTAETVMLTERNADSMMFEGSITTTMNPAVSGDGMLSVSPSDTVTVRYTDTLDCDGAVDIPYISTAQIDCVQPLISNVSEKNITDTSASIAWNTDEDSSSVVHWGENKPPSSTASEEEMTQSHEVSLAGLQQCTIYYYAVESEDIAGNIATDNSGGQYYHFETYGNFGSGLQPCNEGRVSINQDIYTCSSTIMFELIDMGLNTDPLVIDTATLRATSTTEVEPELIVVTETGENTSTFSGSIQLLQGVPTQDGVLQVKDGDTVTVTYLDVDDGTGTSSVSFDNAIVDCRGPGIQNLRLANITDQRLAVRFDTIDPGNTVVEWGSTPSLGNIITQTAMTTSHEVVINTLDICQELYLRVSSTDSNGNNSIGDLDGTPHLIRSWDIPGLYWRETFEGDTSGWTLTGEWQIGTPQGKGGSSGSPDPSAAYNNARAMGDDLTGLGAHQGDYEHSVTEDATSQTLNAGTWSDTKLLLYRQLNVMRDDLAKIVIMRRNKENEVYSSGNVAITQSDYAIATYDVSNLVDGQNSIKVRFKIISDPYNAFLDDGIASGWNIDDVILKDGSQPDYGPCGSCGTPPSFNGAKSAVDNDACGADGVTISWEQAVSWGTGGSGTYTIYRDAIADFIPSPANRIAAGVAGLSYNDVAAPVETTLYYIVRAEDDEMCGSGANNNGLTDSNTVHVSVTETTSQLIPGEVMTLRAKMINFAHLRLSWEAMTDAAYYRIYRSTAPDGEFILLGQSTDLYYDDHNQGGNANNYYYKVTGVNACGQEGQ